MLVWLLKNVSPLAHGLEAAATGDSRVYLSARIALATLSSFLVAWLLGPMAIRWLKARFRERIASASERLNALQAAKAATPTMGGLFLIGAIVFATLLCADLANPFVQQGLVVVVGYGCIGGIDDWIKARTARRGLSAFQKLQLQTTVAAVVAIWLWSVLSARPHGLELSAPFGEYALWLGPFFIPWGMLVMVGSSNGVNLTDGLDGLAGGCLVFAGGAFTALCYLAGHRGMAEYFDIPMISGAGELGVLCGAMVGALLGFLWYNCYPAQVFMGDTGSLPTGALLGLAALATRQEALLVIVGGIFVIETFSVILQVAWFRLTGRRLIACSPLHNHYLFRGEHEIKIVVRFWIGSALLALIAVASLKLR